MPLFSRRSRDPEPTGQPDETFPFLTVDEAARLRSLVASAFAAIRSEVVIHADHVVAEDGTEFGLTNLAATCHAEKPGAWPDLVQQHVARISRSTQQPSELATITPEALHERIYPRLVARDQRLPMMGYAREVTEDLLEVLCLDQPDTVAFLTDERLERLGPAGPLFDSARRNLRAVTFEAHEVLPAGDDATFHCLLDESVFTATTALILGEVAEAIGDPIDPEYGAFFVVANRQQVAFHAWHGGATFEAVFSGLLRWAELGYSDGVGPLSPELFWWRPGGIEQLSRRDADGGIAVELSGDLAALIERVG